jgi:hypothetical protein
MHSAGMLLQLAAGVIHFCPAIMRYLNRFRTPVAEPGESESACKARSPRLRFWLTWVILKS